MIFKIAENAECSAMRAAASGSDGCGGGSAMAIEIYYLLNISPQRTQRTQSQCNNVFATFAVSASYIDTTLILYSTRCPTVIKKQHALSRPNPDDTKNEIIFQSSPTKSSSVNPDWRIILLRVLG